MCFDERPAIDMIYGAYVSRLLTCGHLLLASCEVILRNNVIISAIAHIMILCRASARRNALSCAAGDERHIAVKRLAAVKEMIYVVK